MSCGRVLFRSSSRTRESMACRSASNALALIAVGMIAVLLLLICWSFGSSSSESLCSVSLLPIAASSAVSVEENRVLHMVSLVREDPCLVLLSVSVAAAVADAVGPVVVVFVGGLVLLLASPVTRLESVVGGMVASFSAVC